MTLIVILALANPSYAELPEGKRLTVGGETFQCYDVPGYKMLLHLDNEVLYLRDKTAGLEESNKVKDNQIDLYKNIVTTQQETILLVSKERSRMFDLWSVENKKRHEAENKPSFSTWLGWGTAGVFMTTTAVLLTVVYVQP